MPPDADPRKRDAGNGLAHPPPVAALDARKLAAVESREHTDYALNVGATLLELTSMNGAERNHYPQASHCGKDLNREPIYNSNQQDPDSSPLSPPRRVRQSMTSTVSGNTLTKGLLNGNRHLKGALNSYLRRRRSFWL